jgi:hypothetical protein
MTQISTERVRALVAAYGAGPQRWPAAERADALRRIAEDPALAAEIEDAARLDALLDALPDPAPNPALRVALKNIPDRSGASLLDRLAAIWPFAGAGWRPATGLAAAAVLGIVVGFSTPESSLANPGNTASGEFAVYDPVANAAAQASGADFLETL